MDLERKIQILADCDFSKWRKWNRAGVKNHKSLAGFSTVLKGIHFDLYNILSGDVNNFGHIQENYGILMMDYSTVPFEDMDKDDEDFKWLYDYKSKLETLGRMLSAFMNKAIANEMHCDENWEEVKNLDTHLQLMLKLDYREVLEQYGIAHSDPPPS